MRWLVNTNGQTSGPMDEAMVRTLVDAGQVAPNAQLREENGIVWIPLNRTPFAAQPGFTAAETAAARPAPTSPVLIFSIVLLIGACAAWFLTTLGGQGGPKQLAAPVAADPTPPTQEPSISSMTDLVDVVDYLRPRFAATGDREDPAAAALGLWCGLHLTWADLQKIPETKRALVMKDPEAEVGKRLCWSGSIVEIHTSRAPGFPIYDGGIINSDGGVVRFLNVGSSGALVDNSPARVCGIVTGVVQYANSGGGTTHAVHVVGMFDIAPNKPARVIPGH